MLLHKLGAPHTCAPPVGCYAEVEKGGFTAGGCWKQYVTSTQLASTITF